MLQPCRTIFQQLRSWPITCSGAAFPEAHHLVGKLVRHCLDEGKLLKDLSSDELAAFHPFLGSDEALARLSPENAVWAKKSRGGTAPAAVRRQLQAAREALKKL